VFKTADHLIPLLKNICIDLEIVPNLSLARDKCKNIMTNAIAKREIDKIINDLKMYKFSILIDENTDISDTKIICVFAKYWLPLNKKIITKLLELMWMQQIISRTKFKKFSLRKKNTIIKYSWNGKRQCISYGCNNSFMSCLKLEIPGLITFNCICHSTALIASKTCEKLPESTKNLIRGVSTYISDSAKRCTIF